MANKKRSNANRNRPKPAQGASPKASPRKPDGQRKQGSNAQRRAAARRAAKRRRQLLMIGIPSAIVLVVVVLLFAFRQGGGQYAAAGSIKVNPPGAHKGVIPNGQPVPSYSAPGLDGGTVSWSPGKPTVLSIWAAWCPHCQVELPKLSKMQSQYPGIEFTSINTAQGQEPGPEPGKFVKDNNITIPVAIDDQARTLLNAMGVTGFPTLYFINADGTVYKEMEGEPPSTELDAALQYLQQQSQGKATGPASPSP